MHVISVVVLWNKERRRNKTEKRERKKKLRKQKAKHNQQQIGESEIQNRRRKKISRQASTHKIGRFGWMIRIINK